MSRHVLTYDDVEILMSIAAGLNPEVYREEVRSVIYKCKAMAVGDRVKVVSR